jgi:TetR/AcrR family transcriptional repressor of nem operon
VKTNQKQFQGEQTRQQIIDEAARLFAAKGFHGTSMSDLTTATGLTKGAFYHHFETKDVLFFAVVRSVQEKWARAVAAEVRRADNALDQLSILLDSHARLLRKEPVLCLVISGLTAEMESSNPSFTAALHNVYAEMIAYIEDIIRHGQAVGQIRGDVDAQLIALNIVGLLRGVSCFGVLREMELTCDTVVQSVVPVLLDGLRPR